MADALSGGVTEEDIREIKAKFFDYEEDATSSLHRDFKAHRPTELDIFCGYLVREGKRLGLSLPLTNMMYEGLRKRG